MRYISNVYACTLISATGINTGQNVNGGSFQITKRPGRGREALHYNQPNDLPGNFGQLKDI